jgi:hypothetical protein
LGAALFLFEFLDLPWIPASLRATVHDVLELCLGMPPREYYNWVANEVLSLAEQYRAESIVELGAGTAPITKALATAIGSQKELDGVSLRFSDLYPNIETYQALEQKFPGLVRGDRRSVDISRPVDYPPGSLLVLSAAFHHIPPPARMQVLKNLSGHRVAIFEPLRRNVASTCLSLMGFFPALTTPLRFWNHSPGNARRIFWCWLFPLAAFIIVWDGVVSCQRCWTGREWKQNLATLIPEERIVFVKSELFSQMIVW